MTCHQTLQAFRESKRRNLRRTLRLPSLQWLCQPQYIRPAAASTVGHSPPLTAISHILRRHCIFGPFLTGYSFQLLAVAVCLKQCNDRFQIESIFTICTIHSLQYVWNRHDVFRYFWIQTCISNFTAQHVWSAIRTYCNSTILFFRTIVPCAIFSDLLWFEWSLNCPFSFSRHYTRWSNSTCKQRHRWSAGAADSHHDQCCSSPARNHHPAVRPDQWWSTDTGAQQSSGGTRWTAPFLPDLSQKIQLIISGLL